MPRDVWTAKPKERKIIKGRNKKQTEDPFTEEIRMFMEKNKSALRTRFKVVRRPHPTPQPHPLRNWGKET